MKKEKNDTVYKNIAIGTMIIYAMISMGLVIYCIMEKRGNYLVRSFCFPVFLLIPLLFRVIKLKDCWKLYIFLYLFIIYAFSYGCVFGGFTGDGTEWVDKLSHFLSGPLFTIVGICIYYRFATKTTKGIGEKWGLAVTYGLFFSAFIAVMWEVCEFVGFILTGNDAQNTLTTGVTDTMYDLIFCMIGSVLCIGSFALWRWKKIKLATPAIIEEFYDKNVLDEK